MVAAAGLCPAPPEDVPPGDPTPVLLRRVIAVAVTPHDLQATILHLLGLEHTRLTHRYQGRDFRLTDVHGTVVRDILA